MGKVVRIFAQGRLQQLAVPDQSSPGTLWHGHSLVRIYHDGIGALDAAERRPGQIGKNKETAVCGVHVEPQPMLARNFRDFLQRINRASIRSARRSDHQKRMQAVALVFLYEP